MTQIIEKLKGIKSAGFFDIFGATVINSMVSFVYGIFIIRILSKSDYGIFSYAQNITSFAFMFCCLGGNTGIMQFCSEAVAVSRKYRYSRFALKMGSVGSALMIAMMMIYIRVDKSNIEGLTLYVMEFALLPFFFFAKEWITANLRWQLKNREYGIVMNVHTILNTCLAVGGAYVMGIQGVIWGMYLAYGGAIVCGIHFLKGGGFWKGVQKAEAVEPADRNNFLKYSLTMCMVNALISVLFTIDLFVIGNIMKDADQIAMYKTACTIPFALNMIPNSIMIFAYPHIAANKNDPAWMKKYIRVLYLANGALNMAIGVFLMVAAPLIIKILFGDAYAEILPMFRILTASYMVSACLRTPAANLLGILKMTKTALLVSVFTVILSATLAILLVNSMGIMGAAVGSVCTFGVVGLVSSAIIFHKVYLKK